MTELEVGFASASWVASLLAVALQQNPKSMYYVKSLTCNISESATLSYLEAANAVR
jgi:hypothetical protein